MPILLAAIIAEVWKAVIRSLRDAIITTLGSPGAFQWHDANAVWRDFHVIQRTPHRTISAGNPSFLLRPLLYSGGIRNFAVPWGHFLQGRGPCLRCHMAQARSVEDVWRGRKKERKNRKAGAFQTAIARLRAHSFVKETRLRLWQHSEENVSPALKN